MFQTSSGTSVCDTSVTAAVHSSAARSRSVKNGVSRQTDTARQAPVGFASLAGIGGVHVYAERAAVDLRGAHLTRLNSHSGNKSGDHFVIRFLHAFRRPAWNSTSRSRASQDLAGQIHRQLCASLGIRVRRSVLPLALANFRLSGHFEQNLRRMHRTWSAWRDRLLARRVVRSVTPNRADPRLEARLIAPVDETALIEAGRMVSVGLDPLAPFHVKALQQRGFLFGYGAVEVERIDAAMTSLASFLRARTLPDAEKRLTYGVFVFEAKHSVRSVLGYPGRSGARLPL